MGRVTLDKFGKFWFGPIKNESNFNYAEFHFFNIFGDPVWILSRSFLPENLIELLPQQEKILRETLRTKNMIQDKPLS